MRINFIIIQNGESLDGHEIVIQLLSPSIAEMEDDGRKEFIFNLDMHSKYYYKL